MLPISKNSKPRTVPARMSAKRRAQFEAEGKVPFSTIKKKLPCGTVEGHGVRLQGARTDSSSLPIDAPAERSVKSGKDGQTEYSLPFCLRTECPSSRYQARPAGKIKRSKRIPPRKKRTGTPIRSKPWPNALDPKSYVLDGRTVLYGKDLENLRREVFIRAFGMCEAKQHVYDCPLAVGWRDGELDHIRARGNGGGWRDDTKENTRWLSPACHKGKHGQY